MSHDYFDDDFESGNLDLWTNNGGVISSTSPYAGTYCADITDATDYITAVLPGAVSSAYVSLYWKPSASWTGDTGPQVVFYSSAISTLNLFLYASDAKIYAYNRTTNIATSGVVLTTDWQRIDIFAYIHDTSGRIIVHHNGVNVIDFTGDTKYSSYTTFDRIRLGDTSIFTNVNSYCFIDNFWVSSCPCVTDYSTVSVQESVVVTIEASVPELVSINISDSISVNEHSVTYTSRLGTVVWGHDTGVEETIIRDFQTNWTGTGSVSGSGDTEVLNISSVEYMESDNIQLGSGNVVMAINKYRSGSLFPVRKYKTASVEADLAGASWNSYTNQFYCAGWVKLRLEGV